MPPQKLLEETKRLQQHLLPNNSNDTADRSTTKDTKTVIRLDDYFNVLEAWMEHAKSVPHNNNHISGSSSQTNHTGIQAAHQARSLLESMEQAAQNHRRQHRRNRHNENNPKQSPINTNTSLAPTLSFYEVVLQAYATCNGGLEAAQQAQTILAFLLEQQQLHRLLLEKQQDNNNNHHQDRRCRRLQPTTKTFNIVLNAWAKSKTRDAGFHAQRIYDHMLLQQQQQQQQQTNPLELSCDPNARTIVTLMDAWNKSGHFEAADHVLALFQSTLERWQVNQLEQQQQQKCKEEANITAADQANTDVADATHSDAAKGKDATGTSGGTDTNDMNAVDDTNTVIFDETVIDNIDNSTETPPPGTETTANTAIGPIIPLDIAMFHAAMDTIVKSAADTARRQGRRRKNNINNNNQSSSSSTQNMTSAQAAQYVEGMLEALLENAAVWKVQPNARTFTIVMDAWARAEFHSSVVQRHHNDHGKAAHRAQAILDLLLNIYYGAHGNQDSALSGLSPVKPNEVTFTTVITAWSHAKQAQKAHDAFQRLLSLYRASGQEDDLTPTIVTGNAVMTAWAKEKRTDFILQIIQTMSKLADATGRLDCQPDLRSFNILLGAYGKAGHVQDALSLLQWIEDGNTKKSDTKEITTNFDFLLQRSDALDGPDVVSYNCVLSALAQHGDTVEAERLLVRMQQQKDIEPDQVTYTSLMNAYARSSDPVKVTKATKLLDEFSKTTQPDTICLVAYLQVCAGAGKNERRMAFASAVEAFERLPPNKINHVAFSNMAKAINQLLVWDATAVTAVDPNPDKVDDLDITWDSKEGLAGERMKRLQVLCIQCSEMGCLSDSVLRELQRAGCNVLHWLRSDFFKPEWSCVVPMHQKPKVLLQQQRNRPRQLHQQRGY